MSTPLFCLKPGLRLVLASASPRRRSFMEEWGLPFDVCVPEAAEPRPLPGEEPAAYVRRAAAAKARAASTCFAFLPAVSRIPAYTTCPACASSRAVRAPKPLDAPLIRMVRFVI